MLSRRFSITREVRTVQINGEPWFVAKDVCEVLEIVNHKDSISRLKESMKSGVAITDPHGRPQVTKVISEAGLYKLIFQSRKPEAEKFADWVAEEVLPAIRKNGYYSTQPKTHAELTLMIAETLVQQEKKLAALETGLETVTNRVDNLDTLSTIPDKRQRLNAMISKLAFSQGNKYGVAWNQFKQAWNIAYGENLEKRITHYKERHNLKKLTIPEYMERENRLDDALRVADKLLNNTDRLSNVRRLY
jgi:prophage antirepressor-like protein